MFSYVTAAWAIAGIILLGGFAAVITWRARAHRQMRLGAAGELVRECSNCGRPMPPHVASCPRCGHDTNLVIR